MKNFSLVVLLVIAFSSAAWAFSKGDIAPDFAVKNQDGKVIKLSDYRGKPVLLYFYPKDETSGCTKEACQFRDEFSRFKKLGAVILGVSTQGQKSHQEFKEKHKLPFDLLADEDGALAKTYGIGTIPIVGLDKRQSVLIGADGKIVREFKDVDPKTHTQEVLKELEALAK